MRPPDRSSGLTGISSSCGRISPRARRAYLEGRRGTAIQPRLHDFRHRPQRRLQLRGGAAYSPVEIRSQSGLHDIHVGDLLPDALSGFLTATPFAYTVTAAPSLFAQGDRMGDSAVRAPPTTSTRRTTGRFRRASPSVTVCAMSWTLPSPKPRGALRAWCSRMPPASPWMPKRRALARVSSSTSSRPIPRTGTVGAHGWA